MAGKLKDEMTPQQLKAERDRKARVGRELRERQKAEREAAQSSAHPPLAGAGDFPALEMAVALAQGVAAGAPLAAPEIPLSEYIEAGELLGILTVSFRLGLDPQDVLSGSERDWLAKHPFGSAIVEERMILHGLGDAYEDWSAESPT